MLWWMPKINNWLHGYIQPLRNNSCRENGWDLLQFDHVFCLTFQGTNAQTAATPHQQPCSYTTQLECIHFCLSKINLACGSTVEPLKKKHVGEYADIHLGCVELTYHFSHHIFRTKIARNLDSSSPSSVCGTSAPAAPDRTMNLYVCIYINIHMYVPICQSD